METLKLKKNRGSWPPSWFVNGLLNYFTLVGWIEFTDQPGVALLHRSATVAHALPIRLPDEELLPRWLRNGVPVRVAGRLLARLDEELLAPNIVLQVLEIHEPTLADMGLNVGLRIETPADLREMAMAPWLIKLDEQSNRVCVSGFVPQWQVLPEPERIPGRPESTCQFDLQIDADATHVMPVRLRYFRGDEMARGMYVGRPVAISTATLRVDVVRSDKLLRRVYVWAHMIRPDSRVVIGTPPAWAMAMDDGQRRRHG